MTTDLRVVVDTNVLICQLLRPQSQPSEAVRLVLRRGVLLTSAEHLRELFDVVMRPKFDAYVEPEVRLAQVRRLAALAEPVRIVRRVRLCRDAKDDMLWKSQPTVELHISLRATLISCGLILSKACGS